MPGYCAARDLRMACVSSATAVRQNSNCVLVCTMPAQKKQKVLENHNCLQENIEYFPLSTFSSTEVIGEGGIGSENSLKAPQTSLKLSLNVNQFGLAISEISSVRQKNLTILHCRYRNILFLFTALFKLKSYRFFGP